jgi:hypothetical protein
VVEKNLGGLSSAADAESVNDIEGDTEVSGSSHGSEEVSEVVVAKFGPVQVRGFLLR